MTANKPLKCIFACIAALFGNIFLSNAQTDTLINHSLYLKHEKSELRKLEKATEYIAEGRNKFDELVSIGEGTEEDLEKLTESYEIYNKGILLSKEIYESQIQTFYQTIKPRFVEELGRPKYLETKGYKFLREAEMRSRRATDSIADGKFIGARQNFGEAIDLEYLGLRSLARTVRVFQDWPVEYPYVWDDYVRPRDYFVDKPSVLPVEKDTLIAVGNEPQSPPPGDPTIAPIVFKVQIAAHTIPMSDEYIRKTIYPGNEKIDLRREGKWFKYSIGEFDTFADAKALMQESDVQRAFIVAYQEGRKLNTTRAIKLNAKRKGLPVPIN